MAPSHALSSSASSCQKLLNSLADNIQCNARPLPRAHTHTHQSVSHIVELQSEADNIAAAHARFIGSLGSTAQRPLLWCSTIAPHTLPGRPSMFPLRCPHTDYLSMDDCTVQMRRPPLTDVVTDLSRAALFKSAIYSRHMSHPIRASGSGNVRTVCAT